ncbi:hypothetical protein M2140_000161 [Clostridiales Family XIII bacterium PM5-7]
MIVNFSDIRFDNFGRVEQPTLLITTMTGDPICTASNYYGLQASFKFNDVSEISFEIPDRILIGDELVHNPSYDEIKGMRVIRMEPYGDFILVNPSVNDDGVKSIKSCKAYSLEYELNYKIMPVLEGTYMLYDPTGESDSTILGIILEHIPNWKVGHVDANVSTRYRTFDDSSESVYSFMMNSIQESYSCVFMFDTKTRTINVYDRDVAVENVPMFLSIENLIQSQTVEELSDEIVTCLSVYGADDTSIMSVNPLASDKIYNLDYFIEIGDIPKELGEKWAKWKENYATYQKLFSDLFSQYYTDQMIYNTQYSRYTDLRGELDALNHVMDTYKTDIYGDHTQEIAECQAKIDAKKEEVADQLEVLDSAEDKLDSDMAMMSEITVLCSFDNFFTAEEMLILNAYLKEDSIQDGTYVVSYASNETNACNQIDPTSPYTVTITEGDLYRSDEYKVLTDEEIESLGLSPSEVEKINEINNTLETTYLGQNFFTINSGKLIVDNADGLFNLKGTVVNSTLSYTEELNANGNHDCVVTFSVDSPLFTVAEDDTPYENALFVVCGELSDFTHNRSTEGQNDGDMSFTLVGGIATLTCDSSIYQRQNTIQDLYDYGTSCLYKLAYPSYEFSVDSANFMALPEFAMFYKDIRLGRSLNVALEDGVYLQPILIEMGVDFDDMTKLDLKFSSKFRANNPEFLLADTIGKSAHSSASLDANKFSYSAFVNSNIENDVEKIINSALDVSKRAIINSKNQDVTIDAGGIHLRKLVDKATGTFDPCEVRMINNEIVFTDDAWDTAGLAIGKLSVDIDGSQQSVMGVVANSLIGNVIIGNKLTIEATGIDPITQQPNITHFRVDGSGAYLGNASFSLQGAPKDGLEGNKMMFDPRFGLVAGDSTLFTISSDGVQPNFLDENGNVVYDGTGVMPAGSSLFFDIETGNASFRGDVYAENGKFSGSIDIGNGVFSVDESGNMTSTSSVIDGEITTSKLIVKDGAEVSGLVVGDNVTMGPNAVITWDQLPSNVVSTSEIGDFVDYSTATSISRYEISTAVINCEQLSAGKWGNDGLGTYLEVGSNYINIRGGRGAISLENGVIDIIAGSVNIDSTIGSMHLGGSESIHLDSRVYCHYAITPNRDGVYGCGLDGQRWSSVYTVNVNASGTIFNTGMPSYTASANVYWGSSSGRLYLATSGSTRAIKDDILPLTAPDISADNLYDVEVVQFKYKEDIIDSEDRRYRKDLPGFIVDDLANAYPVAVDYGEDGKMETWNPRYMIPPMLKLIQEHKVEIDKLRAEIDELKGVK